MLGSKEIKILDAAEQIFITQGFQDSSVRNIACTAGVSAAMLNYYFDSKDKLFSEVIKRRISCLKNQNVAMPENLDTVKKLIFTANKTIDLLFDNIAFFKFIMREKLAERERKTSGLINEYFKERENEFREILTAGIQNYQLRALDVDFTCILISGLFTNCLLNTKNFEAAASNKNYRLRLEIFFENYFKGLA